MLTVVYGPPASGKTQNRDKFARHYDHTTIIDGVSRQHRSRRFYDDSGKVHNDLPRDALLLTAMTRNQCLSFLQKHKRWATLVPINVALQEATTEAS